MSGSEDEPYSSIFTSLKHPVRRKMLRILSEKPRSFSEMLEALGISSSHLTYHLESLGQLVSKTDDGRYKLSAFGEAAVGTMIRVEETPKATQPKRLSSFPMKWKILLVALLIGLVVLAGVSTIQYQSLNRISDEYAQLEKAMELVKKGALFQAEYNLEFGYEFLKINDSMLSFRLIGPSYCAFYSPHDNCTLNLSLSSASPSDLSGVPLRPPEYMPLTLQSGNVFDLSYNETAPVVWSVNATVTSTYSISLASMGWYTISLIGPITTSYAHADQDIQLFWGPTPTIYTVGLVIDWSASLTMMYRGTVSPFIITTNALP
jgi:DNA-binding transcriptional ArsR family regulator